MRGLRIALAWMLVSALVGCDQSPLPGVPACTSDKMAAVETNIFLNTGVSGVGGYLTYGQFGAHVDRVIDRKQVSFDPGAHELVCQGTLVVSVGSKQDTKEYVFELAIKPTDTHGHASVQGRIMKVPPHPSVP